MPEQAITTEPKPTEAATDTTQGDPADKPLGPNGEKALAAERSRADTAEKAVKEYAAKFKAIEDANLGDLERAQKEAAEARAELAQITHQNLTNSVALAKGVPADLVQFLTGDTAEAISAKADVLLSRLNAPTTPKPDPSQGAGQGGGAGSTADSFAAFFNSQI